MSLTNPTAILFDINGNPVMVSGGMVLPVGTLGQLAAAVDANGLVQYLQTVSGSLQITGRVWNTGGPVGVSASINLPVWQTGPVGISASAALAVWNQGGPVGVSGSVTVGGQVSVNNFPATQNVSGSVFVTTTGSLGMQVGNAPYDPLWITTTGSLPVTFGALPQLQISNFPATQNVSGTVAAVIQNWPATIGVSASTTLPVSLASQVSVNNFPGTQNVSGSITVGSWGNNVTASVQGAPGGIPLSVFSAGTIGVSGTVTLGSQVSVNNFPATQNVSGTVTVGGQVSVNNFPGTQNVSGTVGAVIQNWPATIGVSASFPLRTWDGGIQGVSASAPFPVWNTGGPVGVSGTVSIGSFPVMAVTGTYISGTTATAPIYPVLEGGLDQNNVVRPFRVDPQGRLTNQSLTSNVNSFACSVSNQTLLSANPNRTGAVFYNDGSANVFLKFGAGATVNNYTVKIGGNGYYELPFTFNGQVDAICSTAVGNIRVTELT